jgi:hypothetical protein
MFKTTSLHHELYDTILLHFVSTSPHDFNASIQYLASKWNLSEESVIKRHVFGGCH